jgi:hypothetical protein
MQAVDGLQTTISQQSDLKQINKKSFGATEFHILTQVFFSCFFSCFFFHTIRSKVVACGKLRAERVVAGIWQRFCFSR